MMFCETCLAHHAAAELCPACGDTLLDPTDDDVIHYLRDRDDSDRRRAIQRFTLLSIVVCLPVPILLLTVWNPSRSRRRGVGRRSAGEQTLYIGGGAYVASVLGLSGLLLKMYPPKQRLAAAMTS